MSVDNNLYNKQHDIWWDKQESLYFLHSGMNPGRVGYFRQVMKDQLQLDPRNKNALDIGCGGGILAEEFTKMGFKVTGIDPSGPSIETAKRHALQANLNIDYRVGSGEKLPFEANSFDIVYCCDVLEHIESWPKVIVEAARVLKPGGPFFYDTINRTGPSNFVFIKLTQEWSLTRFVPPHLHDWSMFIKPEELTSTMAEKGLQPCETVGLSPKINPLQMMMLMHQVNRKRIDFAEFGSRAGFQSSADVSLSYMGYALKAS